MLSTLTLIAAGTMVEAQHALHGAGTEALSSSTALAAGATAADLSPYYNNVGITYDTNPGAGNFDGYNDSYSAQALQAAGIVAGQAVSYGGVSFRWPKAAPGSPGDVLAQGQTVSLAAPTAGATLAFLGATAHNSSAGTGTVIYSDGSTQSFQLSLSDWALNGGKIQPSPGDSIAATLPYHNGSSGRSSQQTYVFYTAVSLQPGKAVARVTLPAFNSFGPLHIFALSVAGSATPAATPAATSTPLPTSTNTPPPTATTTPSPTGTNTPLPTATSTSSPTVTKTPVASTATASATATATTTQPAAATSSGIDLSRYVNDTGISSDTNPGAGNFDGYNDSYSAQALQAAGIAVGQTVSYGGVTFQWPKAAPGSPGDVLAQGQTISLAAPTAGTTLAFLGATAHNSSAGTGTVIYSDGSTQSFQLSLSDWTLNGGQIQPSQGDSIAATLPYHNGSSGRSSQQTYLFYTTVSLQPGKAVTSVVLPALSSFGPLHIFAMTVLTGTPFPPAATSTTAPPTATGTPAPPAATATSTPAPPAATATAAPGADPPLALGAMVDGAGVDPAAIDAFNALVYPAGNGHVAAVNYFHNWADSPNAFDPAIPDAMYARHAVPFLTWGSCDGSQDPSCLDANVAAGSHDAFLHQYARAVAAWGKVIYLRFDHEMNGGWYPWHPGSYGQTDADFVAMWRHVHDIFAAEGAANVRWVWCPNTTPGGDPFAGMYPGDAYVDDVCLDGYNWGNTQPWSVWHSFKDEFLASYQALTALTAKPVIIGETASAESGGDKAAWITQAFLTDVPASFPRVRAILWFNANKETDWRVNSSAASLAAYQQAAASPLLQGPMP